MTSLTAITFSTPLGRFSVALNAKEEVVGTAFGDLAALRRRLPRGTTIIVSGARTAAAVRSQLREYFAGRRRRFSLALRPQGTAFQQAVWAALAAIPCGETRTYAEIATSLGRPKAARAVGRANATNPICLIVPCHRVVGANGSLTGFAFGTALKRRLLEFERDQVAADRAA